MIKEKNNLRLITLIAFLSVILTISTILVFVFLPKKNNDDGGAVDKTTIVQNDFRVLQLAFESVSKEHGGFNSFGTSAWSAPMFNNGGNAWGATNFNGGGFGGTTTVSSSGTSSSRPGIPNL